MSTEDMSTEDMSTEDMSTEDMTQILEVINAKGDTGELEAILERYPLEEKKEPAQPSK